ncbi:RE1 [Symbiodinium sp. CCMP2592]|nr:RE1 [Symbiodinium sp. CCMP2592]
MISPAMKDISSTSSIWWSQVVDAATSYYQHWLMCDPVARLSLQPSQPYRFEHTKYARVEQRALTMLLRAVPTVIKEELVANRKLSCIELLALVHTTYQPGGLKERSALLRYLTNPDGCTEPVAALRSIKRWSRWKHRAAELHISTPDPTLLLGGVDMMVSKALALYPESQFRISSYRFAKSIDHQPTEAKVVELVRFVQGELETLVASGTVRSKTKPDGDADAGKRLRIAKVEDNDAKGKGKSRDDAPKGAEGKGKAICKHWRTDKGCRFAKACKFAHEPLHPSEKRCFACSALNHMRSECPYEPKDGRASENPKGKGKGGETVAKASAQASAPASNNPMPPSQSSSQAPATDSEDILKKAAAMIETLQTSIKTVGDGYGGQGKVRADGDFLNFRKDPYELLGKAFSASVHEGVRARYFLAANLSVPFDVHVAGSEKPVADEPDEPAPSASEEPAEWEQAGDYEELDAEHKQVGELLPEEGVDKDNYLSKVQMVNVPFGIPLKNKGAQEVLRALKLIDARASCLGIKIARLHSDKGAEFDNRFVRDWAASRGIWKSSTGGDNWRSNGTAEALVGILKDSVRVLLRDAGLGPRDWPYALRHAAGRLFQSRVKALGWDLPPLVPFGAKVFVHRRTWHLKKDADKEWAAKAVEARVLAPAFEVDGGYLVRTVKDELYNTSCVYENVEYLDPARFVIPEDKATEADILRVKVSWAGRVAVSQLGLLMSQCRRHADVSQPTQFADDDFVDDAVRHAVVRKILELEQSSCAKAGEELVYSLLPDAEVLCTHTVPLVEVERYYGLWKDALEKELHSMTHEKQALKVISEEELTKYQEAGTRAMVIPSKLVCTRKSGGRFKARLVACGNYVDLGGKDGENRSASVDLYAGGIDAAVLRQVLAHAAKKGSWSAGTTDVSTAFLNAELLDRQNPLTKPAPLSQEVPSEVVVLRPPSLLIRHGLLPARSLMLVQGAVYGLDQSPRDWGIRRDKDLRTIRLMLDTCEYRLVMSDVDNNLWFLTTGRKSDPVVACLMVYVDDLLATGPLAVIRPLLDEISKLWQCGTVSFLPEDTSEVPLVFFGYEIRRVGRSFHLSQRDYVKELATRYHDLPAPSTPLPPGTLDIPLAEEQSASDLKQCQAMLGEALWVSTRTRPDVCFAVSRLSQAMSKNAAVVRPLCLHLLGYLCRTKDFGLLYTDQYPVQGEPGSVASVTGKYVVEAQTDAAFAPTCERSHEATMVYTEGSLTGWLSTRQPFVASSTAEAELLSLTTGFSYGRSQRFVIEEVEGCKIDLRVLNDNLAATTICNSPSTNWRTRHLRIRAAHLREQISEGECSVSHVEGARNTADLGTKALQPQRFEMLRAMMGVVSLSEVTARPAAATVSSGPPVEEALRVVVAALCVASVKGQPLSEGSDDFGFWRLILLWSVLVILVWEIVKWGCRVSCRRFVLPDMPEPDSEASQSEREQEPDDEDLLVETDRPQVTAEPLDEDPGVMPFRYADDVVYLVPRRPTIAYHTEPEQQVLEQAGIRRRHALRVYAPEPDDEPLPQVRGVGSDDVPREAERVVRVSDLAPLPSFQEGGPLRRLVEARERAEVLQGMLNMPPMVPIVLHPFWPAPPQLTVRELRTMASEWGGPASSLYQEPHPAYHGDQYIYVPDVRPRVLVRWHMRPRVGLFHPEQAPTPIPLGALTGQRRTLQGFANGDRVIWDDRFTNPDPERPHENLRRGRTELEVDPDELARLQGGNEDSD